MRYPMPKRIAFFMLHLRHNHLYAWRWKMVPKLLLWAETFGRMSLQHHDYRHRRVFEKPPPGWFLVRWLFALAMWLRPPFAEQRCGYLTKFEADEGKGPCKRRLISYEEMYYQKCRFHLLAWSLCETLKRGKVFPA